MHWSSTASEQVRAFCLLVLGLTLGTSSSAAAPQLWSKQPGTPTFDYFNCVTSDGSGGVYCAGASQGALFGPALGGYDNIVAHYDAQGQLVFGVQFGTGGLDHASELATDGAGGVFVVGSSDTPVGGMGFGVLDAFVARVNSAGNLHWSTAIGASKTVAANGVAPDGVGGCFVVIACESSVLGSWQGFGDVGLARLDATGNYLWWLQFGSAGNDVPEFATADGQGGVIVGGWTGGDLGGPATGSVDAWYANYDSAGNLLWLRKFGSSANDRLRDAVLDGAGGLILVGETWGSMVAGTQYGQSDLLLARVDGSGSFLWTQQYGSSGREEGYAVALAPSGAIFAAGTTDWNFGGVFSGKLDDLWVAKFAPDGSQPVIFQKGFHDYDSAYDLLVTETGGVYAAGVVTGPLFEPGSNSGASDAWVARFEACDFEFASNYCSALPNSTGKTASISHQGSRVVTLNDFVLAAKDLPTFQLGLFIMGPGQASTPFGNGTLCVGGGILRLLPAVGTGPGSCTLALDFTNPSSTASQIDAGETWNFQFWYRDVAAGGAGFNLSNGLSATFCP